MDINDRAVIKNDNRILGILCILLAPTAALFGLFGLQGNGPEYWWSISATYYASSKVFMIGLLFATAVRLYSYKGYDKIDRRLTDFAGMCALGILIFPCDCVASNVTENTFPFISIATSNIIHCIFAGLLFATFAIILAWRFPKTVNKTDNPIQIFKDAFSIKYGGKKRMRNRIYYLSACVIVIFIVMQVLSSTILDIPQMTIINEFMMLTAFGISWLVKSEAFKALND